MYIINNKIIKLRLKNLSVCLFFIAFLSIQWTTPHGHLSKNHNHDGINHQHQIQVHVHPYIASMDFSHETSHWDIITFDYKFNIQKNKKQEFFSINLFSSVVSPLLVISRKSVKIPDDVNIKSSYWVHSSFNPRAPPSVS